MRLKHAAAEAHGSARTVHVFPATGARHPPDVETSVSRLQGAFLGQLPDSREPGVLENLRVPRTFPDLTTDSHRLWSQDRGEMGSGGSPLKEPTPRYGD